MAVSVGQHVPQNLAYSNMHVHDEGKASGKLSEAIKQY